MKFSIAKVQQIIRRIAIAMLLVMIVTGAMAWWLMPDINRMRPQIEALLQQELNLSELKLEGLSWYWAGHLGLKVKHCSLKTKNTMIRIDDTSLNIQISSIKLLFGELLPSRIALHGGQLQLDASNYKHARQQVIPPIHFVMDDMDVQWRYASYQGDLKSTALDIDISEGSALLRMPGFRLTAKMNTQAQLVSADWKFDNTHWLPLEWQKFILGEVSGEAHLQQQADFQWKLDMHTQGKSAVIDLPAGPFQLSFDQLLSTWLIQFDEDYNLQTWDIPSLKWQQGKNQGHGRADWQNGAFSLTANSGYLDMPLLWSWLRPLESSKNWLTWLASMHHGTASDIEVSLHIPWATPLQGLPETQDWQKLRYHVRSHIEDVDIHLGIDDNKLLRSKGKVEVDEHGLRADISYAKLPHGIGTGSGTLYIPWDTLDMDIKAHGNIDIGKAQQWLRPSRAETLHWVDASTDVSVELQWNPLKKKPNFAHVSLRPTSTWRLKPNHVPLQVKSGEVTWDIQHGLYAKELDVHSKFLHGKLSFHVLEDAQQSLQLKSLNSDVQGDFAQLVAYYHIPIEKPSGRLDAHIIFDDSWHGSLDLKQAAWKNLLGSNKTANTPMQVSFQGSLKDGSLKLHHFFCDQAPIQLSGTGSLNQYGLKLDFTSLQAPAFKGALKVSAPFASEPWEMIINAQYLNRKALPEKLPQTEILADKPWALQAKIDTFVWDDASMKDVSIKLASKRNSAGAFKAREIHSGSIILQDISALFALPGNSAVDLRQLSASMGEQHLMLSASLTPKTGGGLRWNGFAQLDGNFGGTMQSAQLTKLFKGGDMQALFLGEGILLKNQPWWDGLRGRLRLRVDNGTILQGGTLTKTLAAISLVDLPDLFFGERKDLTQDGMYYKRLQIESSLKNQMFHIHKLGLRSSAMDIAGEGNLNLEKNTIDLKMIVRPFQNIDALLRKIPLLRDILGGSAHSFLRKLYHMHGPITNASVDSMSPKEAGASQSGVIETLLSIPELWFGKNTDIKK